jgi:tRNA nucleotidyltransferase (CCA-adding enzyme)
MKIYLVGGAVRDALLNRPVVEKDYVVVGSSVDEMLAHKFQPVGKAFPVFLHPKTKEEYALARTEKKVAKGYHGFTFQADPSVTLEEDLIRRDLTINAMAQDLETGEIIDPYGGKQDLDNKILRHVSEAFVEDPVRILRLARFAARFGFSVAPDTLILMKKMVNNGEVDALVPERVWKECESALSEPHPEVFFEMLAACGALERLFPHLTDLKPLQTATALSSSPLIRFAVLPPAAFVKYRLPKEYTELANLVHAHHQEVHSAPTLSAEQLITLLEQLDAFRRPERLEPFLTACQAINLETSSAPSARLRLAHETATKITAAQIPQGLIGQAIRQAIHEARVSILAQII